jgi:uncharacterized membrane protein YdbT with pleckstrin-like domain
MANWIKWWKSKFAWTLIGVVLLTMVISFLFAYFFDWGWIVAIITACSGGFTLRKLIKKKIDDYVKSLEK